MHHFNEFIYPSHEDTGKLMLGLLMGLRSGKLPHRMNTMRTREKTGHCCVLQGGVPSQDMTASTLRKSFKSSWLLLMPYQKLW